MDTYDGLAGDAEQDTRNDWGFPEPDVECAPTDNGTWLRRIALERACAPNLAYSDIPDGSDTVRRAEAFLAFLRGETWVG